MHIHTYICDLIYVSFKFMFYTINGDDFKAIMKISHSLLLTPTLAQAKAYLCAFVNKVGQ